MMTALLNSPYKGKGALIIEAVIASHRLHPTDFFGPSHQSHLVEARREAARKLIDAGFSKNLAAKLLRRKHTTVLNYLPDLQRSKARRYNGQRILRHLAPDIAEVVARFAEAEGVSVHMLMANWVADRATQADSKARDAA